MFLSLRHENMLYFQNWWTFHNLWWIGDNYVLSRGRREGQVRVDNKIWDKFQCKKKDMDHLNIILIVYNTNYPLSLLIFWWLLMIIAEICLLKMCHLLIIIELKNNFIRDYLQNNMNKSENVQTMENNDNDHSYKLGRQSKIKVRTTGTWY